MPLVVVAIAGAFLFGGGSTLKVAVAADPPAATSGVHVDGPGKTTGTPDVLRVVLGVTLRRPDVSAALADVNARQTRLRDALKRAGVAPPQQLPQTLDPFRAVAASAGKVADIPLDAGSSQVSVSVTVRWALR